MKLSRRALLSAIALSVLTLLYLQAVEARRIADHRIGVYFALDDPLLIGSVEAGSPADGLLRPGDRIHTLLGRSLDSMAGYDALASRFERGRPVAMTVERDGELLKVEVTPGMPVAWTGFLASAGVSLCYLALALLVLYHRMAGDIRAVVLAYFGIAVAVEFALPGYVVGAPALSLGLGVFFSFLNGLQAALEIHLAALIPRRRPWLARRPRLVPIGYALAIGTGLAAGVVSLIEESSGTVPAWIFRSSEIYHELFLPVWALAIVALLVRPALSWHEPLGRKQAQLVLAGVLPWAAFTLAETWAYRFGMPAFLTRLAPEPDLWLIADRLFPFVLLCYPAAVFTAIFRAHLFDLQMMVRRSMLYTALTSVMILLFYAAVGVGGALLSQLLEGDGSVWVVGGATLILGLIFSPLKRVVERLMSRRLYPSRFARRRRLAGLAAELPSKVRLPAMGRHVSEELRDIFEVQSVSLLLAQPQARTLVPVAGTRDDGGPCDTAIFISNLDDPAVEWLRLSGRPQPATLFGQLDERLAAYLDACGVDLVAPVMHREALVGLLLLGGRVEGDRFPAEEVELLELFSHHVAAVLENARLFESATQDGLTGLLRRETILERLGLELERSVRYRRPLSVGMADLDRFKEINDRHGHLTGDRLLQRIARALEGSLRGTDWVGRYGGEEFLFVLPETDLAGAMTVADKIRRAVGEVKVESGDGGEEIWSTISIGLASLWEASGADAHISADRLIANADRALFRAKHGGRDRVETDSSVSVVVETP